jgi:hypothetical protein
MSGRLEGDSSRRRIAITVGARDDSRQPQRRQVIWRVCRQRLIKLRPAKRREQVCAPRFGLILSIVLLSSFLGQSAESQVKTTFSPLELVKTVIHSELNCSDDREAQWKYLLRKQVEGKQETREVVETRSGSLDRLIAVAGRPLSGIERHDEMERILRLSHDRAEQEKLEQAHQKNEEQYNAFLRIIPQAFLFERVGESGQLVELRFKPSPSFQPSSRVERVLQEMAGEIWVDAAQNRLAVIHGVLMNDIRFAGGLLGRLEKGGEFTLKRTEIAPKLWVVTQIAVNMRGKAVLVKNISIQQNEIHSDFQRVSNDLNLSDAAGLLLKHGLVAALQ